MKAFITGLLGQDGATLAKYLLQQEIEVYGLVRRTSTRSTWRIDGIADRIKIVEGDLLDQGSLFRALDQVKPDFIVNLAAQSFVGLSWQQPSLTFDITATGALNLLEAFRAVCPKARYYQASSSEMFGKSIGANSKQNEDTPFKPRSPYGVAKLAAHHMTVNYRESYGLFAVSGILFNHDGPLRGPEFVTRKITHQCARIKYGLQDKIKLGDISTKRDFSHAEDMVKAMWLMLKNSEPEDFVVGSGETHTIKEFLTEVLKRMELSDDIVEIDKSLMRPAEVNHLCADATRIREKLGWKPSVGFEQLVDIMVEEDLKKAKRELEISKL